MLSLLLAAIALPCTTLAASHFNLTQRAVTFSFPYGSTKVRGVNLGYESVYAANTYMDPKLMHLEQRLARIGTLYYPFLVRCYR